MSALLVLQTLLSPLEGNSFLIMRCYNTNISVSLLLVKTYTSSNQVSEVYSELLEFWFTSGFSTVQTI